MPTNVSDENTSGPPSAVGFGEQVAPGSVLVVPTGAPEQVIVTVSVGMAGFGVALHVGVAGGATTVKVTGISIESLLLARLYSGDVPLPLRQAYAL